MCVRSGFACIVCVRSYEVRLLVWCVNYVCVYTVCAYEIRIPVWCVHVRMKCVRVYTACICV